MFSRVSFRTAEAPPSQLPHQGPLACYSWNCIAILLNRANWWDVYLHITTSNIHSIHAAQLPSTNATFQEASPVARCFLTNDVKFYLSFHLLVTLWIDETVHVQPIFQRWGSSGILRIIHLNNRWCLRYKLVRVSLLCQLVLRLAHVIETCELFRRFSVWWVSGMVNKTLHCINDHLFATGDHEYFSFF